MPDPNGLAELERYCHAYARTRAELSERMQDLEDTLRKLKRDKLRAIKAAVVTATKDKHAIVAWVDAHQEQFVRPRSQIYHGIKAGYQKQKGGLAWDDDASVVARIKKQHKKIADQLIITKEKPSKAGLQSLDAAALKKLGVTVDSDGDVIVCKPVDGEVEKLVERLLDEKLEEADA